MCYRSSFYDCATRGLKRGYRSENAGYAYDSNSRWTNGSTCSGPGDPSPRRENGLTCDRFYDKQRTNDATRDNDSRTSRVSATMSKVGYAASNKNAVRQEAETSNQTHCRF